MLFSHFGLLFDFSLYGHFFFSFTLCFLRIACNGLLIEDLIDEFLFVQFLETADSNLIRQISQLGNELVFKLRVRVRDLDRP